MTESTSIAGSQPDVSVLIVNYNVKDYLLQCLRSLQAGTAGVVKEIIVVDNNSVDNSVADLQLLFPDVTWIALPENLGFGRANNEGLWPAVRC
ncbi:MAG: glycosyltransferase [Candidatus Kapabacteria bacterium]|nr:glycosyltransferase [Candidatus Kapabacteria bacterium]